MWEVKKIDGMYKVVKGGLFHSEHYVYIVAEHVADILNKRIQPCGCSACALAV